MTRTEQKQRERGILEAYKQSRKLDGSVIECERPDFIIENQDACIGVEITEYHQPKYPKHTFSRTNVEEEWKSLRTLIASYRANVLSLDNLRVLLNFSKLRVPPKKDHYQFLIEIHEIIDKQSQLTDDVITIPITDDHPDILKAYLKSFEVRKVGCYLEWDWNHAYARIGTSQDELLSILKEKLSFKRPAHLSELNLVLFGNGMSGSTQIGMLSVDQLNQWLKLNEELSMSDFDVVAILNSKGMYIWRKITGWSQINLTE